MRRSVVQEIAPLLATIAIAALLGCEEPPSPGPMGPPGPPAEPPVEQPEDPKQPPDTPEHPEQPAEPTEQAPVPVGTIHLDLFVGDAITIDVAAHFIDPDEQTLTYTTWSSARDIAIASASGSTVTVTAVAEGTATITVTATDEDDLTASQTFTVTVEPIPEPPLSVGARVSISSTPSGAYITINGDTSNARTPATLDLPPGTHELTIHKPGVGTTKGLVLAEKDLVDAEPDQNIHVTLNSTETDRFPTLREYDGDSVVPYSWPIVVDDSVEYEFLPLGREGDPPLTMQFENLPPGMAFEQVTATDRSGYTGPTLIIYGTPTREGTFSGSYKVTDNDGDTFSFPFSFEVEPQPEPPPPDDPRCSYKTFMPLMERVSDVGPICVTSSTAVPSQTLDDVGEVFAMMLAHRADVRTRLRREGTLAAIFDYDTETVCDNPYFANIDPDRCTYAIGLGGGKRLACPGSQPGHSGRYRFKTCVHEFAHSIQIAGLREAERRAIRSRYDSQEIRRIWSRSYEGSMYNVREFFAWTSTMYFSALSPSAFDGISNREALRRHDPVTYELIHGIYRGSTDLR